MIIHMKNHSANSSRACSSMLLAEYLKDNNETLTGQNSKAQIEKEYNSNNNEIISLNSPTHESAHGGQHKPYKLPIP